jgi:hypothetical protein
MKTGIINDQMVGLTPNQTIKPSRIRKDIPKSIIFPNIGDIGITSRGKYTLVIRFFELIKLPVALVRELEKNVQGTNAV